MWGAMGAGVVRHIVRRHLNEARYCYHKELGVATDLEGTVTVEFTIGETGQVVAARVRASSLRRMAVEQCLVRAVLRWRFPGPSAGLARVSYPFRFTTRGD